MGTQDEKREKDNFIMLPTVDFCFKELMQNPKVRKGFIAAILGKAPKEVRRTTLVPTALRKESEDDKPGEIYTGQIKEGEDYDKLRKCIHVSILEFVYFPQDKKCCRKIVFCDAETGEQYTDLMELYILELKKLPPEDQSEKGIIRWMRFLGGKSRKEFEDMARKDEYIEEAYNELKKLSLDEQKRLEYELRQKAVRDHNMMMKSAEKRGLEIGEKRGEERRIEIGKRQGEQLALKRIIERQLENGKTEKETADLLGMDIQEVRELAGK